MNADFTDACGFFTADTASSVFICAYQRPSVVNRDKSVTEAAIKAGGVAGADPRRGGSVRIAEGGTTGASLERGGDFPICVYLTKEMSTDFTD
jgi:hypothetical protein